MRTATILNFGAGVDSTAIGVGLVQRYRTGDLQARPDLIIFADTGAELPETYQNVERMAAWFVAHGFPTITTVSRPTQIKGSTGDLSIEDNVIRNETVPGEALGCGNCSIKWKHDPMDRFLFGMKRPRRAGWLELHGFEGKPLRLIGYDAAEVLSGKRARHVEITEDRLNRYAYPLVQWGWDRERCIREIVAEGLPAPVKSACFFCPNQKPCELRSMAGNHPALFLRALRVEEVARRGRHGFQKIEGLWRRTRKRDGRPGSWVEWAKREGLLEAAEAASGATLEQLIGDVKPDLARLEGATR